MDQLHCVTNRWGYVQSKSPEQTMVVLEEKLPKKYWIEINRLLVPFGKHVCTWYAPALLDMLAAGYVPANWCNKPTIVLVVRQLTGA